MNKCSFLKKDTHPSAVLETSLLNENVLKLHLNPIAAYVEIKISHKNWEILPMICLPKQKKKINALKTWLNKNIISHTHMHTSVHTHT